MDACCNTASNLYHYLFEDTEINIDTIVIAVAELSNRILQLREEIVEFKNENEINFTVRCNLSRTFKIIEAILQFALCFLTPSEFNDSTKNVEKRMGAQDELQRNFKGDDSPAGTDLSARLSFTKRALEVKATNEAVVFKEDYPHDDKSIEDDERPNRSRVFEASGLYPKSILDAEKFGKEISKRSSENVRDIGDVRISCVADEKLQELNKYQDKIDYNPSNVNNTSKIKRKKISRGVQYTLIGYQKHEQFFPSCFRSKKYNLTRKMQKKETLRDNIGLRNEANEILDATINNESYVKLNKTSDMKKEKFENNMKKMRKIIFRVDNNLKNHSKKNRNPFKNLWQSKALMYNENLKIQHNSRSSHNFNINNDSETDKKKISESSFENNRMNGTREHGSQSEKIFDYKINSNNMQRSAITNFERENIANKVNERLDLCIVELNGIIGDVCVVFGSGRNAARRTADHS